MPVLDTYLFFTGQCAEAMRFYERTLGGKIEMVMTYGQSPQPQQCPHRPCPAPQGRPCSRRSQPTARRRRSR